MKEAVKELIGEGEYWLEHYALDGYQEHVEDFYLKFTTKTRLVFRKLISDPLELEKDFSNLNITSFDETQLDDILNLLKKAECYFEVDTSEGFWQFLHPLVTNLAKDKFEQGYYADAVETVLKEINSIIKVRYKATTGHEEDGATLMNRAFSANNPVFPFDDITTETRNKCAKDTKGITTLWFFVVTINY